MYIVRHKNHHECTSPEVKKLITYLENSKKLSVTLDEQIKHSENELYQKYPQLGENAIEMLIVEEEEEEENEE